MNSINFANPFLLLIGILLLGFVVVPFFIQIKKSGFNFHNIASLVIHIVIAVLVTLAFSGMKLTLTITQTDVYILADCSYSSSKNLDTIDLYINDLSKNLPSNSKVGIICYGNDYEVITPLGSKIRSVSDCNIDDSQTNVRPALEYAATLFNEDSIKRIVVISDGGQTNEESIKGLINDYESNDIHIDAIFLDNNLSEDADEFQISSVEYNLNTYIDNSEDANIVIDSNKDVKIAKLLVTDFSKTIYEELISLNKGSNNFTINLDTSTEGVHSYEVKLLEYSDKENTSKTDTNPYNNIYYFNQTVNKEIKILYLSNDSLSGISEYEEFKDLYSDSRYKIDSYINTESVPYLLEDLCKYDEIVLNNFNVGASSFSSYANTFVYNLNLAVSEYGKSLITFGNTNVQNSTGDDALYTLGSMLPISYDEALTNMSSYVILLDISKSMTQISHLYVAKQVACNYLDLLNNNDYFTIIPFYGDNYELFSGKATSKNIEYTKELINKLEGKQATNIGGALQLAYDKLKLSNYQNKHVLLISDGLSYSQDKSNVSSIIKSMNDINITIDLVYVNETSNETQMLRQSITSVGGTIYTITTLEEANGDVFDEISSEKKDIFKDKGNYSITISLKNNKVVEGISSLSNTINDFYGGVAKSSADTILTVKDSSVTYPLYSTWNYGNGRVSSLSCNLGRMYKTSECNENIFLSNVVSSSTSKMKNNSTLIVDVITTGSLTNISVTPATFNKKTNMTLTIIDPNGDTKTYNMYISNNNYYYSFESTISGSYKIEIIYGTQTYSELMNVSYSEEYNSFVNYNSSFLYTVITSDGNVSEDGKLIISNEGLPVKTFTYEFTALFMVISCALFVCDIVIRKLRWQDVKDIFKHHHKEV